MIQFNLLPDIKKEYIKARRTKRLIITTSLTVSGVCFGVLLLLFLTVQVAQKNNIDDLTRDINTDLSSLRSIEDLDRMLTVQNQLASLSDLHQQKPEVSRLFTYLIQLTPVEAEISTLSLDLPSASMTIRGEADTLATVNEFADTLKFSRYTIGADDTEYEPFSEIITRLNRDGDTASYTIQLVFDALIFDNTQEISLVVPNIVTTRSETAIPGEPLSQEDDVFDDAPIILEEGEE